MQAETSDAVSSSKVRLTIAGFVAFTFIGYFAIGLALAVLPIFIHRQLGYNKNKQRISVWHKSEQ
jgi:hypothetical protein